MTETNSRFSVIMTVYDNAQELRQFLSAFLTQDYAPSYEVIVVDESSTDHTEDVLKLQKQQYPQLYTTFLPKPNRNITRRKLALTIGVKAAKNEWVIFSDIHAAPPSSTWLGEIAETLDKNTDIQLGYFRKSDTRLQAFEDVGLASRYVRKAERIKADGHRGNHLKYLRGKYDFIVVRKDKAHDVLKFFEQKIGFRRLLGLRMSVMCHNLR
jgi:glycosyltransferase involved in cell wall biosynthesis